MMLLLFTMLCYVCLCSVWQNVEEEQERGHPKCGEGDDAWGPQCTVHQVAGAPGLGH